MDALSLFLVFFGCGGLLGVGLAAIVMGRPQGGALVWALICATMALAGFGRIAIQVMFKGAA